jgi:hypothetical protein
MEAELAKSVFMELHFSIKVNIHFDMHKFAQ